MNSSTNKGKFETRIVSDLTSEMEWKGAINSIAGVIHVVRMISTSEVSTHDIWT
jgi:hypothetical protein